jgi:uncharacterized delta-60 repeat protein
MPRFAFPRSFAGALVTKLLGFAALGILMLVAAPLGAQSGTGAIWEEFGPWNSNGNFFEITRIVDGGMPAGAVAADGKGRVLSVNTWRDAALDASHDCAVTRHLLDARTLDMAFTGELEATRRIALDLGGTDTDRCTAITVDGFNRPVIVGYADTAGPYAAFVVRLRESNGGYDTTFSTDGRFSLQSLVGFIGLDTRFADVEIDSAGRVLACGTVERDGEQNMLVMRFTTGGALDTSFNGIGYREIDFNGAGADDDTCDAMLRLPDGRIVLAGTTNGAFSGDRGYGLVRLLENGSPDPTFTADGRVFLSDNSDFTVPDVVDVAYDAGRERLIVAANLSGSGLPAGGLVAVSYGGGLDTTFNGNGRRNVRFSDFGIIVVRGTGATTLDRVLMRTDGTFYVAGTHENTAGDAAEFGDTDAALARIRPDGDDDTGTAGFSGDGVAFYAFAGMGHSNVRPSAERLRVGDELRDAIFYRGNVLLLTQTNRYPEGVWSNTSYDLGPVAPVLAAVVTERLWDEDWEFDGLAEPTNVFLAIPVPAGYGRYCSVRDPVSGSYGLLPQGATSDPCQFFLDQNPNVIIERAGLYSLSGPNNVLATCAGGYVGLHPGNGTAPFDSAFANSAGETDCIFTAAPAALPVFDRPYTGAHTVDTAQSFNHDAYNLPLDVSDFGQTPNGAHPLAHWVDLNGIQKCNGSDANGDGLDDPFGGIDEPAVDILVGSSRDVVAVAAGRVASAVPRYVLRYSPVENDPHQREVFIRHSVGTGRYSEQFTTYYAHMSETLVRRGDVVEAGDALGQVGTTGASSGNHLHISVMRHKNLSYRASFEHGYAHVGFDQGKEVAAIDPWGWRGLPATDPWAWRFRNVEGRPDDAGSWSINLWKPGEAPTMD